MKIALSIPDDLFHAAEQLAKHRGFSRSRIYQEALKAYLKADDSSAITEALDRVYADEAQSSLDPVLEELQRASLPKENW
jgi:predicted transcriptional regulator